MRAAGIRNACGRVVRSLSVSAKSFAEPAEKRSARAVVRGSLCNEVIRRARRKGKYPRTGPYTTRATPMPPNTTQLTYTTPGAPPGQCMYVIDYTYIYYTLPVTEFVTHPKKGVGE